VIDGVSEKKWPKKGMESSASPEYRCGVAVGMSINPQEIHFAVLSEVMLGCCGWLITGG